MYIIFMLTLTGIALYTALLVDKATDGCKVRRTWGLGVMFVTIGMVIFAWGAACHLAHTPLVSPYSHTVITGVQLIVASLLLLVPGSIAVIRNKKTKGN